MNIQYTSPYSPYDDVICHLCDKFIDEQDGLYHCSIDEKDYHRGCLNKNIKKKSDDPIKLQNIDIEF